jgi:glycosyltransferase involved in cell wall biosynthesis
VFVYRGQLTVERSRIEFLLGATCRAFDEVDAVMISPGLGATEAEFAAFTRSYSAVLRTSYLAGGRARWWSTRAALRRIVGDDAHAVVAVGFSAAAYVRPSAPWIWCINGIPEERLLHRPTLIQRGATRAAWWLSRRGARADLTVVVSAPMAGLVRRRMGEFAHLVVPNAVDRSVFRASERPNTARRYLTYAGGGSPWQGLDRLALVWAALHELDPLLRFRVITTDQRAHVLTNGVPPEAIEVFACPTPHDVARCLQESSLGFLVREPNLVNEVSFPMKLGEYLGAGSPVVVTRCGWDVERLIERHGAGVVVDWHDSPNEIAAQIVDYMRREDPHRSDALEGAADELDMSQWIETLAAAMSSAAAGVS